MGGLPAHSCAGLPLFGAYGRQCVCFKPLTASHFSDGISVYFRTERKYHIDGRRSDCVGTSTGLFHSLQMLLQ